MNSSQPAIEPRSGAPYRPDIDGLRGIAVLAVVLYHAFPAAFGGGFVGVDVFFVVSGYLITGIVLDDLERGRFRFAHFYARRIRRLFPALVAVLCTAFAFAWFYLLEDEFRQFARHVAAASVFGSNFVLWSESGYFDTAAAAKPLLHLWSLGIEEQFYLAWPLIVWATWRKKAVLLALVCALALGSLALEISHTAGDPVGSFFSPLARFWELLAGIFLAVTGSRIAPRFAVASSLAGLAAIAIACFAIGPSSIFPGWWALLPVAGTCLVIASGPNSIVHQRMLAARSLVWVGLISYPLYLWHWPLLSFAHILQVDTIGLRVAIVLAAFALAWMTWRWLERPIRTAQTRPRARIAILVGALAALGILGALAANGIVMSVGAMRSGYFTAERKWTYAQNDRLKPVVFSDADFEGARKLRDDLAKYGNAMSFRWIPSGTHKKALFVGDSHMEQYWSRPDELIRRDPAHARSAIFLTASSFLPIPAAKTSAELHPEFVGLAQTVIAYALSDPDIDTVVLSSVWSRHLADFTPLPPGYESPYYVEIDGRRERVGHGTRANELAFASFAEMIRVLRRANKRVFIVGEVVRGSAVVERGLSGFSIRAVDVPASRYLDEMGGIRAKLAKIAAETGAEVLDPFPMLCPDGISCSPLYDGLHPVYMDRSHLSDRFVRTHANFLDRTILID